MYAEQWLRKRRTGIGTSHQRRRWSEALIEAEVKLMARIADLGAAVSFAKLHDVMNDAVRAMTSVTFLYGAPRIAAKRDLRPSRVNLHGCGTGRGEAARFGMEAGLPGPFDP